MPCGPKDDRTLYEFIHTQRPVTSHWQRLQTSGTMVVGISAFLAAKIADFVAIAYLDAKPVSSLLLIPIGPYHTELLANCH